MADKIRKFKIKNFPSERDFAKFSFGQSLDYIRGFEKFKAENKSIHLSQKHQTYNKAIKEAIALYNVSEYYCDFYCNSDRKDDSFQFWFK